MEFREAGCGPNRQAAALNPEPPLPNSDIQNRKRTNKKTHDRRVIAVIMRFPFSRLPGLVVTPFGDL